MLPLAIQCHTHYHLHPFYFILFEVKDLVAKQHPTNTLYKSEYLGMVKCTTMYVNTVGCPLTQLIQIDHVHKQLMLLVWECRVYQMRFPNLCGHSTSNTSITKSNTHLLVINLAWPNICVCQGWGIDRSFDFKLFCIFDCHMQTHYSLFTHTCR